MDILSKLGTKTEHPQIKDLVLLCKVLRSLGGQQTLSHVAEGLQEDPVHVYRRFNKLAKQLDEDGKIFHVHGKKGVEVVDATLLNRLEHFLTAYHDLVKPSDDWSPRIRIGAPQILSARVLPKPIAEFRRRHDYQVAIDLHCDDPHNLLERANFDLILTSCPQGFQSPDAVAEWTVHNCLICPSHHPLLNECGIKNGRRRLRDWSALSGHSVVTYADERAAPGIPWDRVSGAERAIRVGTALEAHGYVSSQSAVAFSYRELLSQEEEKYFEILDPPDNLTTRVVLLQPRTQVEDRVGLDELADLLSSHLNDIEDQAQISVKLSKRIRAFRSAWYARDVLKSGKRRPVWCGADLELAVTDSGYVRGYQTLRNGGVVLGSRPPVGGLDYITFGRIKKRQDEWHLIMRGAWESEQTEDHFEIQFLLHTDDLTRMPKRDLKSQSHVGVWMGRTLDFGLASGPAIFMKQSVDEVTAPDLKAAFNAWAKERPWLKRQDWKLPTTLVR